MYTWKMRNSDTDSKHFVESVDFLSIPCQNPQKPSQNCAFYLLCGFLRNWQVPISAKKSSRRTIVFSLAYLRKLYELELEKKMGDGHAQAELRPVMVFKQHQTRAQQPESPRELFYKDLLHIQWFCDKLRWTQSHPTM